MGDLFILTQRFLVTCKHSKFGEVVSVLLNGLFIRIAYKFRFGAKMTDASSKINVSRLKVGDLLIRILVGLHSAFLGLVFHVLGRSRSS